MNTESGIMLFGPNNNFMIFYFHLAYIIKARQKWWLWFKKKIKNSKTVKINY